MQMINKKGLGRGLEELLSVFDEETEEKEAPEDFVSWEEPSVDGDTAEAASDASEETDAAEAANEEAADIEKDSLISP